MKIIQGIAASEGVVTGKICKFESGDDLDKFESGSILVTRITDPSMIQVMIQSKAIITDIGGITSHPAIVSRELGIPCVVNTKIATKVLKNKDQVKINGNTGQITILD